MTQVELNSLGLAIGVIGLFLTVLTGYNRLMKEMKNFREDIGDQVDRDRKIDHIISHNADIDSISDILKEIEKSNKKLERDYKKLSEHDAMIALNAQHIAQDRAITDDQQKAIRLILESLLAIMLALEAQGINHKTSKAMEDLRAFLLNK